MNNNKIFRLFISSTFSDFKAERDLLQTNVFPELSNLCAKHGFGFMPIDLRWGVSEGAQLNQKTLELCLSEVRSCNSEPHPDFVILSGGRYGWVPLPYMIDANEFDEIVSHIADADKPLVETWYRLDKNQIPSAYILQKREGEYEAYSRWVEIEKELLGVLEHGVEKSSLHEDQKKRYVTSATELEFDEFKRHAEHDGDSLFLVSRTIDSNGQGAQGFIEQSDRLIAFKEQLCNIVIEDHHIFLNAKLVADTEVDDEYLQSFADQLTQKLTYSITAEIDRIKSFESISEHDLHASHKNQLSTLVLGRDKEIEDILAYLDDTTSQQPLILHGVSGIGKSAIMARSIDEALKRSSSKTLYRFCGITKNSSSIESLIISMLGEIGLDVEAKSNNNNDDSTELQNKLDTSIDTIDDMRKQFIVKQNQTMANQSISQIKKAITKAKIDNALTNIEKPTVIFIDAMDQLENRDKLEWLPSILPETLKIVISVLEDEKYSDDGYYYEKLTTLYSQNAFYRVSAIENTEIATQIITHLLSQYDRTLQPHQMEYLLTRYEKAQSPFYLKIIAEEVRHWSSEKTDLQLADTSMGAVSEYIENLWELYHHEPQLVQKVLGYIYAARESISESQLYEILCNDTELIHLVENIYHENLSGKLPMVVWARLSSQLSAFLKEGENGNLQFFHREFRDGAKRFYTYELSQGLLSILERMIEDEHSADIRESLTYIHIFTLSNQKKELPNALIEQRRDYMLHLAVIDINCVKLYIYLLYKNVSLKGDILKDNFEEEYRDILLILLESLYLQTPQLWIIDLYVMQLQDCAEYYQTLNRTNDEARLYEKIHLIIKTLYIKDNPNYSIRYIKSLGDLSSVYQELKRYDEVVMIQEEILSILESQYKEYIPECTRDYGNFLGRLAFTYQQLERFDEAVIIYEKAILIFEPHYFENKSNIYNGKNYIILLDNFSDAYKAIDRINEATLLDKKRLEVLENLVSALQELENFDEAVEFQIEAHSIIKSFYAEDASQWVEDYIVSLNYIASFFGKLRRFDDALIFIEKAHLIIKPLYVEEASQWAEEYTKTLDNLAYTYYMIDRKKDALELYLTAYQVRCNYFGDNDFYALDFKSSCDFIISELSQEK